MTKKTDEFTRKEINKTCLNCGNRLGEHNVDTFACPIRKSINNPNPGFYDSQRFKKN